MVLENINVQKIIFPMIVNLNKMGDVHIIMK